MLPTASTYTPSTSTYYCDNTWYNNSQVDVALFGSCSSYGLEVGAFALALNNAASVSWWRYGASLSALLLDAKKRTGTLIPILYKDYKFIIRYINYVIDIIYCIIYEKYITFTMIFCCIFINHFISRYFCE